MSDRVIEGVRGEEMMGSLRADVREELGHSERLGQRLEQLNARPPGSAESTARPGLRA